MVQSDHPCKNFDECGRQAYSKGYCLMHYKRVWRGGAAEKPQRVPVGKDLDYNLRFHGWTETQVVPTLSPCWEWGGGISALGYGFLYSGGQTWMAHRASYTSWVEPIPDGLFVCHACDNRRCINPEHLWLGTNQDNMIDMYAKNRGNRPSGTHVHNNVLTIEQVKEAKRTRKAGGNLADLARRFGVEYGAINQASRPNKWVWLEEEMK